MTKLGKKNGGRKHRVHRRTHAEELIQASRYSHEFIGELYQYDQLKKQLVTSSSDEDQHDI